MAEVVTTRYMCDMCDFLEEPGVPATIKHRIKVDDEPLKEYDHCKHSERLISWFLDYLREHGKTVETPAPQQVPAARKDPSEKTCQQLAPAPAQEPAPDTVTTSRPKKRAKTAPTAADTRDKETASGPPPKKKKLDDQEKRAEGAVWCPEPHPTRHGAGMWVTVGGGQGSHARECHGHAKLWDIAWEDRDSILSVPCTAHARCKEIKLAFRTEQGLRQHIIACPLPRIDLDGAQPTQEDIGA